MAQNWKFFVFSCILTSRISADSQLDCGCKFKEIFEDFSGSLILADCSNRKTIDFKCLKEINPYKILLTNNNYTEVPPELLELKFNETQHIDLSKNSIEHLPYGLLNIFPKLQSADFSYNNLTNPMEILRIDGELKLSIEHNHFLCNCNDPDITKLSRCQQKQNTMLRCKSDSGDRLDLPLTAKCHNQLNPEPPQKDTGKYAVWIAAFLFLFVTWVLSFIVKCLWTRLACNRNRNRDQTELLPEII